MNIGFALYATRRLRTSRDEAAQTLPSGTDLDYPALFLHDIRDLMPDATFTILTRVTSRTPEFEYGTPDDARDMDLVVVYHAMEPMIALTSIPKIMGDGNVKPMQQAKYLADAVIAFNRAPQRVQLVDDLRSIRYAGKGRDFAYPWHTLASASVTVDNVLSYRGKSRNRPPGTHRWSRRVSGYWEGPDVHEYAGFDTVALRRVDRPDYDGRDRVALFGLERSKRVGASMARMVTQARDAGLQVDVIGRWPSLGVNYVVPVTELDHVMSRWRAAWVFPSDQRPIRRRFVTLKPWELAAHGVVPIAVNDYDPDGYTPALQGDPIELARRLVTNDELYVRQAKRARRAYERRLRERPHVTAAVEEIRQCV